ncbi:hypothetical protein TGDOM2_309080 [Toxoplasma gondii GAB2-2007-GAL-DOM2]|uniref:Uncharacterized protein n=3 Tax=Toxoplasma gondii TaxID=5811 RepID=A0A086LGA7_TOXGO|nr:hypothetical protein TGDOM2_309080 [Toxoplasma gondii GAB2-2007-GAL-DOM2]KFG55675.1 hypothetical protein TGFOU_309080 [Toxoplasma gondii FOU]PUA92048.1 hypothetical protein TGBR9_309080 [Toxoplasma gondii TgCATBr9]
MTKLSAKGEKRDELCLLWDAVQAEGAHNEQVRSLLGEIAVALTEANGELKNAAEVYRRKRASLRVCHPSSSPASSSSFSSSSFSSSSSQSSSSSTAPCPPLGCASRSSSFSASSFLSVSPSAPSPVSWASASSASGTPEHVSHDEEDEEICLPRGFYRRLLRTERRRQREQANRRQLLQAPTSRLAPGPSRRTGDKRFLSSSSSSLSSLLSSAFARRYLGDASALEAPRGPPRPRRAAEETPEGGGRREKTRSEPDRRHAVRQRAARNRKHKTRKRESETGGESARGEQRRNKRPRNRLHIYRGDFVEIRWKSPRGTREKNAETAQSEERADAGREDGRDSNGQTAERTDSGRDKREAGDAHRATVEEARRRGRSEERRERGRGRADARPFWTDRQRRSTESSTQTLRFSTAQSRGTSDQSDVQREKSTRENEVENSHRRSCPRRHRAEPAKDTGTETPTAGRKTAGARKKEGERTKDGARRTEEEKREARRGIREKGRGRRRRGATDLSESEERGQKRQEDTPEEDLETLGNIIGKIRNVATQLQFLESIQEKRERSQQRLIDAYQSFQSDFRLAGKQGNPPRNRQSKRCYTSSSSSPSLSPRSSASSPRSSASSSRSSPSSSRSSPSSLRSSPSSSRSSPSSRLCSLSPRRHATHRKASSRRRLRRGEEDAVSLARPDCSDKRLFASGDEKNEREKATGEARAERERKRGEKKAFDDFAREEMSPGREYDSWKTGKKLGERSEDFMRDTRPPSSCPPFCPYPHYPLSFSPLGRFPPHSASCGLSHSPFPVFPVDPYSCGNSSVCLACSVPSSSSPVVHHLPPCPLPSSPSPSSSAFPAAPSGPLSSSSVPYSFSPVVHHLPPCPLPSSSSPSSSAFPAAPSGPLSPPSTPPSRPPSLASASPLPPSLASARAASGIEAIRVTFRPAPSAFCADSDGEASLPSFRLSQREGSASSEVPASWRPERQFMAVQSHACVRDAVSSSFESLVSSLSDGEEASRGRDERDRSCGSREQRTPEKIRSSLSETTDREGETSTPTVDQGACCAVRQPPTFLTESRALKDVEEVEGLEEGVKGAERDTANAHRAEEGKQMEGDKRAGSGDFDGHAGSACRPAGRESEKKERTDLDGTDEGRLDAAFEKIDQERRTLHSSSESQASSATSHALSASRRPSPSPAHSSCTPSSTTLSASSVASSSASLCSSFMSASRSLRPADAFADSARRSTLPRGAGQTVGASALPPMPRPFSDFESLRMRLLALQSFSRQKQLQAALRAKQQAREVREESERKRQGQQREDQGIQETLPSKSLASSLFSSSLAFSPSFAGSVPSSPSATASSSTSLSSSSSSLSSLSSSSSSSSSFLSSSSLPSLSLACSSSSPCSSSGSFSASLVPSLSVEMAVEAASATDQAARVATHSPAVATRGPHRREAVEARDQLHTEERKHRAGERECGGEDARRRSRGEEERAVRRSVSGTRRKERRKKPRSESLKDFSKENEERLLTLLLAEDAAEPRRGGGGRRSQRRGGTNWEKLFNFSWLADDPSEEEH